MSGGALHPGALSAELASRALVVACEEYGVDPQTVFERAFDGRGRARLLAAAAMVHPTDRPADQCARLMALHANQLAPSQMARRGVTAEAVARVQAALTTVVLAPAQPVAARHRRGEAGWVNPRRDLAREARIIEARRKGDAPAVIATREGIGLSTVKAVLSKSGAVFASVRPGPHQATARPPKPAAPRKPRAKPVAEPMAAQKTVPMTATGPAATPVPLDPFPSDHPTWAPLPGSTPVRLIDHHKGCRWPVTVEGRREPMVCNQAGVSGNPYCPQHRWLGASPAIRATLTRPVDLPAAPRVAATADADLLKDEAA